MFGFHDDRIYESRTQWRCVNVPSYQDDFLEWMTANFGEDWNIHTHYEKRRSHGGWGNKGGWVEHPIVADIVFKSEGAELLFRLHWQKFE
jgi:hypothetical protein